MNGPADKSHVIGAATCPVCGSRKASLRLAKTQRVYLVCNACQVQVFARSGQSDEALRRLLVAPTAAPTQAPAPEPEHRPAPAPEPEPASGVRASSLFMWG
jgi:hypothetical protein